MGHPRGSPILTPPAAPCSYLGGAKIIERLKGPGFMMGFCTKGRLSPLLENIPVRVILNDRMALLGAARCANKRVTD